MRLTPLLGSHQTILFNVTEFENELQQIRCDVGLDEYLIWIIHELGYPVLAPPWMAEPKLPWLAMRVRRAHVTEIGVLLRNMLIPAGYKGQELLVCAQGRAYCSISFPKE